LSLKKLSEHRHIYKSSASCITAQYTKTGCRFAELIQHDGCTPESLPGGIIVNRHDGSGFALVQLEDEIIQVGKGGYRDRIKKPRISGVF